VLQRLQCGKGGTVSTFFTGRRPVSCTVTLTKNDGTAFVSSQACTLDPVNTTLTAAANGSTGTAGTPTSQLQVASTTGMATRNRYLVGDEEVTIKQVIDGSNVLLWSPVMRDKPIGTPFVGLGVSAVIANVPGVTDTPLWDCFAIFTTDQGDDQTETLQVVQRVIPKRLISEIDIRNIDPKLAGSLSAELDLFMAFDIARDRMFIDLGDSQRADTFLGVDHFRNLCAHRFWLDREFEFGAEWKDQFDKIRAEYDRLKRQVMAETSELNADGTASAPTFAGAYPFIDLEVL
jgi:hypothetical protein